MLIKSKHYKTILFYWLIGDLDESQRSKNLNEQRGHERLKLGPAWSQAIGTQQLHNRLDHY